MPIDPQQAQVVVIEDNADNLFITTDLLQNVLKVSYCNARASGRQLFKLLESNLTLRPNLILLDIQLPNEDGYTVLQQIRRHPRLQETVVVAVTANVMPQDVERARTVGFNGFIGKPISARRFPQQIERILAGESVWEAR
jgi:two-component system, cell cycle response regulator DivK